LTFLTLQTTMAANNSPGKPLTSNKSYGSELYRLVEGSSKQSRQTFSLPTTTSSGARKHRRGSRDNSLLPHSYKTHLASLFTEIETEFESLYLENVRLREQINEMEKACSLDNNKVETDDTDGFDMNVIKSFTKKNFPKTRHKLKAQTNKIVSSFKTSVAASWCLVSEFRGHKDGIWDVAVAGSVLGTASADRTARLWSVESGKCVMRYGGHEGSVNSIKFQPGQELVITSSGDGSAHVWSASPAYISKQYSDTESGDSSDDGTGGLDVVGGGVALVVLSGHQGVVVSADWLAGGDQAVTASWDRTAALWDISSATMVQTLPGHDMELTGAACHPSSRLVVTSSKDSTFRLWDFREAIHAVSVFQGHTESVTSAAFSRTEHIVSGSDDRTVKVWDLRNMRAPLTNIQTDSQVNKVSISTSGMVAVAQDNRQVYIYDISGAKIARLPRDQGKCHMRMVSSVAWAGDQDTNKPGLFSVGFDRVGFGWRMRSKEEQKVV